MQYSIVTLVAFIASAFAAPTASTGWSIKGFTRNCRQTYVCRYNFTIETGSDSQQCTVEDGDKEVETHTFSALSCEEKNGFKAAWGWDEKDNFAVLTVVHVPTQTEAFFGYNDPNAGLPVASYPDLGPYQVQHTK